MNKYKRYPVNRDDVAVFRAADAGPVFGNGDIYICSDSNVKKDSYSNLGTAYNCGNLKENTVMMAGEANFLVEEIEVFRISTL